MNTGGLTESQDAHGRTYEGDTSGEFDIDRLIIPGHLTFKDVNFKHKFTAKHLQN